MIIKDILSKQRKFFDTNKTKEASFRIKQLKKFKILLKENENLLYTAIFQDFGK